MKTTETRLFSFKELNQAAKDKIIERADRIQTICEQDLEYHQTPAAILEYLDQDAEIYTEDGTEF